MLAGAVVSQLEEGHAPIQLRALQTLNGILDTHWAEAAPALQTMWVSCDSWG